MIKLTCNCYVAADQISEITTNLYSETLTVRMKNGFGHAVPPDYGKGAHATMERILMEVEKEMSAYAGIKAIPNGDG